MQFKLEVLVTGDNLKEIILQHIEVLDDVVSLVDGDVWKRWHKKRFLSSGLCNVKNCAPKSLPSTSQRWQYAGTDDREHNNDASERWHNAGTDDKEDNNDDDYIDDGDQFNSTDSEVEDNPVTTNLQHVETNQFHHVGSTRSQRFESKKPQRVQFSTSNHVESTQPKSVESTDRQHVHLLPLLNERYMDDKTVIKVENTDEKEYFSFSKEIDNYYAVDVKSEPVDNDEYYEQKDWERPSNQNTNVHSGQFPYEEFPASRQLLEISKVGSVKEIPESNVSKRSLPISQFVHDRLTNRIRCGAKRKKDSYSVGANFSSANSSLFTDKTGALTSNNSSSDREQHLQNNSSTSSLHSFQTEREFRKSEPSKLREILNQKTQTTAMASIIMKELLQMAEEDQGSLPQPTVMQPQPPAPVSASNSVLRYLLNS